MTSANRWRHMIDADPDHSVRYAQRFADMEAAGHDLGGEARLLDAMLERGSRVLDAGCGTGRVGGRLAAAGHSVVGVDLDPYLIDRAKADFPGAQWHVGDLEDLDVAALEGPFDLAFSAGNVLGFIDPQRRGAVFDALAQLVRPDGRLVIGLGAGRGYAFDDLFADQTAAGFDIDLTLSSWGLLPFDETSGFVVSISRRRETLADLSAPSRAAAQASARPPIGPAATGPSLL